MTTYIKFITLYSYLNGVLYIDKLIKMFIIHVMKGKFMVSHVKNRDGFTLTELLLAVGIVGIIAALVLPMVVSRYNSSMLDHAYNREINTIQSAVEGLTVSENRKSFFETMMYTDVKPDSYENSSGNFMKKYLRVARYCGDNNGNCFADSYQAYKLGNDRIEFEPNYTGSCASLKNGVSLCIAPQVSSVGIHGILDLNGPKGPNILGRDLRTFSFEPKRRVAMDRTTSDVFVTKNPNLDLGGNSDPEPEPEQPKDPEPPKPPEILKPVDPPEPSKNFSSVKVTCDEKNGTQSCQVTIVNAKFSIATLTTIPGSKPPLAVGPGGLPVYNPGLGGNYEKPSYGVDGIGSKPGEKHNVSTYDRSSAFIIFGSQDIGVCQVFDGNDMVRYSTRGLDCLKVDESYFY